MKKGEARGVRRESRDGGRLGRRKIGRFLDRCSVKTAFALYAAAGLAVALAASIAVSGVLGTFADDMMMEVWRYSGIYIYDEQDRALVPATSLSWYEAPSSEVDLDAPDGFETALEVFVEQADSRHRGTINLDEPPNEAGAWRFAVVGSHEGREERPKLPLSDIPACDARYQATGLGADEARAVAAEMPPNAAGAAPQVSAIAYYLPYGDDPLPRRALVVAMVASVPIIFALCLVVAGRRFYRRKLRKPIEAMDAAARKIAAGDLDFAMEPVGGGELGALCSQFETMRGELDRANRTLWRAAENRRRVNAAFAHDLRTPLTVIKGRAEMLALRAQAGAVDAQRVRDDAAAMMRQAERLERYAESMRDLDALENDAVNRQPVDLAEWFSQASSDAETVVRAAGKELACEREGLPTCALADAAALSRVADNLVANASRYAHERVRLSAEWHAGTLTLTVEDDGPGLDDDALARGCEPFWRGDAERAADCGTAGSSGAAASQSIEPHFGLGLFICTLLCEQHGGTLHMENAPSGGARFVATFDAPAA